MERNKKWFDKGLQFIFLSAVIVMGFSVIVGTGGSSVTTDDTGIDEPMGTKETLSATIRWTSYGVPHIKAVNFKNAAFGQGYVFARDSLCILADQIIKVRSERSLYFGPGDNDKNITSDFGYKALNVYQDARDNFDKLRKEEQGILIAYAAGYNKFLSEAGIEGLSPECRGQDWVKPIDEIDLLAYYLSLSFLASSERVLPYLLAAAPPNAKRSLASLKEESLTDSAEIAEALMGLPNFKKLPLGSNGWGIGGDMTETGRGALLANPHFPHTGPLKFYESHLTIPGVTNIHGGALYGVPGVLMGFNEHIAWAHTVAASNHFTLYKLDLAEGYPTTYMYDDEIREMTHRDITIQILQPDGTLKDESRTIYSSHYGLMFAFPPILNWNYKTAYTIKDANKHNFELVSQWIAMAKAANLDEFQTVFKEYNGIPWVNTMYADDKGNAFYVDGTRVPKLSRKAIDGFKLSLKNDLLTSTLNNMGIVLLNGSDSMYEWQGDIGPGLVPFEGIDGEGGIKEYEAPKLLRRDFIANSNNSHWLTNPEEPLEGYSPLFGPEKTPRSLRTRMGLKLLKDSAGADGRFSADEIREALFSDRMLLGELVYDQLLERCPREGIKMVELDSGESVDIVPACSALEKWDGRVKLDSTAAHVFREFGSHFTWDLFATSFDKDQPVTTPSGLVPVPENGPDPVLACLALAVRDLETAGISLDARLGEIQFAYRGDEKIPLHGGLGGLGVFNMTMYSGPSGFFGNRTLYPMRAAGNVINQFTGLHSEGYFFNYGTSLVYAVEFTDDGPKAQGLITYSQSNYPDSDHFADQTWLFSQSKFRPMLFTEEEIAADPNLVIETIETEIDK